MRKIVLPLLTIGLVGTFSAQSFAIDDRGCDTREKILAYLAQKYGEQVVSIAILDPVKEGAPGYVLERTESPDHATFSLIISTPDGKRTCPLAAGAGWNDIQPKIKGEPM